MKRYTVIVHNLTMCMEEDNTDSNYFKGDNYLISSVSHG